MERWHEQQLKILKDWGEISASYRWLHYYSYIRYKIKNYCYMIPVIIMSTIAGTANFAQSQVPGIFSNYIALVIGFINILSAIITTIYQFTKIAELMESHRLSSISYGKLSRNIDVIINLPQEYRKPTGEEFLKECKTELDKLIDSSESIPKDLLKKYAVIANRHGIKQPEISKIYRKNIFGIIDSFVPTEFKRKYNFWWKNNTKNTLNNTQNIQNIQNTEYTEYTENNLNNLETISVDSFQDIIDDYKIDQKKDDELNSVP